MANYDVFYELLNNKELNERQYEIVEGRWPKEYNEVVLEVDEYNRISDYTMYSLGLLNQDDLKEDFNKMTSGEKVTTKDYSFTIDEVMNFANDALTPIESNYERYKNSIGKMICRILFYMKKENYIYDYKYEEQDKKVLMKEEKGNSIEEILANYYEEPRYVTKYEKEYDIKVFFSPTYSKYEIINYEEELFNPDRIKI